MDEIINILKKYKFKRNIFNVDILDVQHNRFKSDYNDYIELSYFDDDFLEINISKSDFMSDMKYIVFNYFLLDDWTIRDEYKGYVWSKNEFNNDRIKTIYIDVKKILLSKEDEPIYEGGFARIFYVNNDLIKKSLTKLSKENIKRFNREISILKKLEDSGYDIAPKVVEVDFNNCTAILTKLKFPLNECSKISNKKEAVYSLIKTFKTLINFKIFHRDIHPGNIMLDNGTIKVIDFNISKDLQTKNSYQTTSIKNYGVLNFIHPEAWSSNDETKLEEFEVYSLIKVINYIYTGNALQNNHKYKLLTLVSNIKTIEELERTIKEIDNPKKPIIDSIIDKPEYLLTLTEKDLFNQIKSIDTRDLFNSFQKLTNENKYDFIEKNIDTLCSMNPWLKFSDYDYIFFFLKRVLLDDNIEHQTKKNAARNIKFIAYDRNRFNAQKFIENANIDDTLWD